MKDWNWSMEEIEWYMCSLPKWFSGIESMDWIVITDWSKILCQCDKTKTAINFIIEINGNLETALRRWDYSVSANLCPALEEWKCREKRRLAENDWIPKDCSLSV